MSETVDVGVPQPEIVAEPLKIKRALLSVSDKTEIIEFARGLAALGVEIISTGGTYTELDGAGIDVKTVEEITGAVQMMRARMHRVAVPEGAVDIVGTGGDGHGTYNISTCAALVAAVKSSSIGASFFFRGGGGGSGRSTGSGAGVTAAFLGFQESLAMPLRTSASFS